MTSEEKTEIFKRIWELIQVAESKIKETERLDTNLDIPSVNQLRYVAYHLARALGSEESDSVEEIEKAKNHCYRAIYDAHELGIIFYLEKIKIFRSNYDDYLFLVRETIPTLVEDFSKASKARKCINAIPRSSISDSKAYYSKVEPYWKELEDIVERFDSAEPIIQAAINKRKEEELKAERKDLKDTRRFVITTVLTAVGIIVGGVVAYLTSR